MTTQNVDLDKCVEVLTRCGPFSRSSGKLYAEGLKDGERQTLLGLHAALAELEERTTQNPQQIKPDALTADQARQALRLIGERFAKLLDGVADRDAKAKGAGALNGGGRKRAEAAGIPAGVPAGQAPSDGSPPLVGTGEP